MIKITKKSKSLERKKRKKVNKMVLKDMKISQKMKKKSLDEYIKKRKKMQNNTSL